VHRGAKIALASGIVLSGLVGAALFRKPPSPATPREPPTAPFDRPIAPVAGEDPPAAARLLGRVDPVRAVETAAPPAAGRTPAAALNDSFAERHSAVESGPPSSARKQAVYSKAQADELASAEPAPGSGQLHKVRDGDTLSSLARHYLGSSKRFLEIYEANRELLSNPDLLPIGAELKIPPAEVAVRTTTPAARVDPPLTPLPARPAERLPSSSGSRRTYRVKMGDTLDAIAKRFYGDGNRYAEIYEANRERLKAPADLREGLLLDIP
jgi:nucleoid-associated protein YgaU